MKIEVKIPPPPQKSFVITLSEEEAGRLASILGKVEDDFASQMFFELIDGGDGVGDENYSVNYQYLYRGSLTPTTS